MNQKKMLPLAVLAAVVLVLAAALALLQRGGEAEQTGIPLCDFSADAIDRLTYSGENTNVTLFKGEEGGWMLESDPTLPLEQQSVQSLLEDVAGLTADRLLQGDELAAIPARSDTPLMEFSIVSGAQTRTLTVDQANDVADIYYVYDEEGTAYTVPQTELAGLCKTPRELYAAQRLTVQTIDEVATLQVGGLQFVQSDGVWTLADDPEYPLDQSAVKRMANTLCGGSVSEEDLPGLLPRLQALFQKLGYMESSSSDLFDQFLKTGMGAKPLIAGYESQLIEYAAENPDEYEKIKEDLVMLYPIPTIWSSHVLIALDENGQKMITGLMDEEIQKLAWKRHGFRTETNGIGKDVGLSCVADSITQVTQVPEYKVMREIFEVLE